MASSNAMRVEDLRELVARYVGQLLHGCGNDACTQVLCVTGRRNGSKGRPVRNYTPRSARVIALVLAEDSRPREHLCEFYLASHSATISHDNEAPRDPSSFIQRVGDSRFLRDFVSVRSPEEPSAPGRDLTLRKGQEKSGKTLDPWKIFLEHWDRKPVLRSKSVAHEALCVLETNHRLHVDVSLDGTLCETGYCASVDKPLDSRPDAAGMAASWLELEQSIDHEARHILSFNFLFNTRDHALCFRFINHLTMRKVVTVSESTSLLRRRVAPNTGDAELQGQLEVAESQYLLLSVSRDNALRDAYDQLWQRRKCELLRPLRVRLGEVGELEVGHDLGGVQIEFFSLICREAFAEESQMFTTDSKTGLSYFRPGSLQPLYMFELLGLLVGLAMYNGITLPISLPLAFYAHLLSSLRIASDSIQDAWPVEFRALKVISTSDIEVDCSFPLEANGLRMAVAPVLTRGQEAHSAVLKRHLQDRGGFAVDHVHQFPILQVFSAMPEGTGCTLSNDEIKNLRWPGWLTIPARLGPDDVVSPEQKTEYVRDYVRWLTVDSVAPQWEAFVGGLHHVISRRNLSIFTPQSLRAYTEGSKIIDVEALRNATTYDGYDGVKSKYISMFWKLVGTWTQEKVMKLLKFVTASERVPSGGVGSLTFKIQRVDLGHRDDEAGDGKTMALPSSSTCFGTLFLPRYPTIEILEERLDLALEYGSEGFGMG